MPSVERTQTIQGFLNEEIRKREMTIRQFARYVGVSHSTIVRMMAEEPDYTPDLDSLFKIAKAVGVDLFSIVAMVMPDAPDIDIEARILAQQITALPAPDREIVARFLAGVGLKLPNKFS